MKILSVFGTRPEAIKMAPVVRALRAEPGLESVVCLSGQHTTMLSQALATFELTGDYNLSAMDGAPGLNPLVGRILGSLDPLLETIKPDTVMVHGDTSTAFAAALAAFHRGIPVAHVEAGLRTGDLSRPFPEEMNRCFVDLVASSMFAPTPAAVDNLQSAGAAGRILLTGNTVVDALQWMARKLDSDTVLSAILAARYDFLDPSRRMVLVTGHRRENFGGGFDAICDALAELAQRDDIQLVYPVHLNPNVRGPVLERLQGLPRVHLLSPLDYPDFVYLMRRASVILTDSGGVQEEAPALGVPVLVMRDVTERPEAVASGAARLVGTDAGDIVQAVARLLSEPAARHQAMRRDIAAQNPYGDGRASERIAALLAGRECEPFRAPSHARAAAVHRNARRRAPITMPKSAPTPVPLSNPTHGPSFPSGGTRSLVASVGAAASKVS
ncbi:non-hydrolyzing UDP-N-acetylglucosamine 2-epimerase [Chitinasiproducens palmae]|uniref:UDP-N-acetylglucosamine 2-epimerase (non-hydrolyzing) n=1 Tax=Chitinasiproducens palmae TaxID=1770053 RepID=A0A1H2PJJ1_9BURK|nr:UDP-N-acetylglucosamine 2-epimerase (non-hydrolyzing) [Chitinasiproducens palmae]SDV46540.1 UDP-N-Acetylglucosamine 2-epimerase [Chitinasiproducens palmae]